MDEVFSYSTETKEEAPKGYMPTRPKIIKLLVENEDGSREEKLYDKSRYPGHVLRKIRADGKHR